MGKNIFLEVGAILVSSSHSYKSIYSICRNGSWTHPSMQVELEGPQQIIFQKMKKKLKENSKAAKLKKNISANRPPPQAHMLSRYNFLKKYAHFHLAVVERSLLKNCRYANNLNLLHLAVVERSQLTSCKFNNVFFLHLIQLLKDEDLVCSFLVH